MAASGSLSTPIEDPGRQACCATAASPDPSAASSSRRRRLWELEPHAHCPVIGVCLPIAALRRLYERHCSANAAADDYHLHCDAMAECRRRTRLADALQREFDRRYALPLQQSARCKTEQHLATWWDDASRTTELAGAVWAAITHARCTPDLQHRLLGEVHMLQHQVGAARRVDHARFEATSEELARKRRDIVTLQERLQRQATDHAREREHDRTQLTLARAELLRRDTAIAALRDAGARVQAIGVAPQPGAADARLERQRERIVELSGALDEARARIRILDAAVARLPEPPAVAVVGTTAKTAQLDERAVLCVGGRPASVPLYRRIVERTGGRFLHHDGGDEESVARLDATLAAADLVICQTGCISHDAYWRVKDHCKRTGKPCVFVENPGSASLRRALNEIDGGT